MSFLQVPLLPVLQVYLVILILVSSTSIAGNLGVTGGLVVDSPAIMAGGLTVMEYLQYGATRIDIPIIEDLPVLAAGATNLIAGATTIHQRRRIKLYLELLNHHSGPRVSVTAARVYEAFIKVLDIGLRAL